MIMTCCHGVSALKSTVTSPVPVIPLMQTKRASMYLTWNVPFDAESMPAKIIGVSVLTQKRQLGFSIIITTEGGCSQENKMNSKEVKPTLEERAPFVLCHPESTGKSVATSRRQSSHKALGACSQSWRVSTSSAISALHSATPATHTKSVFLIAGTNSAY